MNMFFGYEGAIFWEMQAGMGDAVAAPLYEVLKRRGVKFAFFHRIESLGLSEDGTRVATIQVARQATLKGGDYEPLVEVKDLTCWPSAPSRLTMAAASAPKHSSIAGCSTPLSPYRRAANGQSEPNSTCPGAASRRTASSPVGSETRAVS